MGYLPDSAQETDTSQIRLPCFPLPLHPSLLHFCADPTPFAYFTRDKHCNGTGRLYCTHSSPTPSTVARGAARACQSRWKELCLAPVNVKHSDVGASKSLVVSRSRRAGITSHQAILETPLHYSWPAEISFSPHSATTSLGRREATAPAKACLRVGDLTGPIIPTVPNLRDLLDYVQWNAGGVLDKRSTISTVAQRPASDAHRAAGDRFWPARQQAGWTSSLLSRRHLCFINCRRTCERWVVLSHCGLATLARG